ncbi:MAG: RNA polymerase factor sigma-54 [Paludibacteraceae bacterium]
MQSTSLTQQQKLQTKLSPTQIQVIRMLELPSIELPQRINEELQENPALEEGKDEGESWASDEGRNDGESGAADGQWEDNERGTNAEDMAGDGANDGQWEADDRRGDREETGEDRYEDMGDRYEDALQNEDFNYEQYVSDDETPEYMYHSDNGQGGGDNGWSTDIPVTGGTSLLEELKAQIYLTKMTKPQRHIAKWVIGNIDDDGYLRRTVEQLVDDLSFQEGLVVSDEEMADIVRQIKEFDPAGVASANLQECLLTQLQRKPQDETTLLAERILEKHFETFTKHHFNKIIQREGCTEEAFQAAVDEILHLNQKPSNAFTGNIVYESHRSAIIPDFIVENRDGELILTLNTGDIPELHVSKEYSSMLAHYSKGKQTNADKEAVRFIRSKIDAARWFIDAIRQRNETLTRTMTSIMQFQQEWFQEGDEGSLKPMILQDIADRTGYDVSTISRVSNSKYVQTQFGIYPLKYFFSESMTNAQGEEISTREIKQLLQELVSQEDKSRPLNDDQLVEVLAKEGYVIARRTVAKYREQMGIPVARLRKR